MGNPLEALSLEQLQRRTSMKWREYPPDVLPLWVAEMDVPLADAIVRALQEAIALGDTGYLVGGAYARAVVGFTGEHWGWSPPIEHTSVVPDVMRGIVEVLRLVTRPGDAVVVNPPVYPPFYAFVEHMGRRVVEAPLTADGRLDPHALERAFDGAAAYLLCSPHNPTGTVHTREELTAVAELARARGVRVVVDEIHAPIELPGATHVPYLSLPGASDAFSLMSASKGWNLAGLKAALAIAGPDAADDLARIPVEVCHGASHLGAIAHVAGLAGGREWLADVIRGIDANRRLLGELLAEQLPGVVYRPPQATYFAWLDCRPLGLADDPAAVFLDHGRVALNSGRAFGAGGGGHVRLNLAASSETIAEAVRRMASAVACFAGTAPRQ